MIKSIDRFVRNQCKYLMNGCIRKFSKGQNLRKNDFTEWQKSASWKIKSSGEKELEYLGSMINDNELLITARS